MSSRNDNVAQDTATSTVVESENVLAPSTPPHHGPWKWCLPLPVLSITVGRSEKSCPTNCCSPNIFLLTATYFLTRNTFEMPRRKVLYVSVESLAKNPTDVSAAIRRTQRHLRSSTARKMTLLSTMPMHLLWSLPRFKDHHHNCLKQSPRNNARSSSAAIWRMNSA